MVTLTAPTFMKSSVACCLLLLATPLVAQERIDATMNAKIRAEGLERSHVAQMFDTIATVIGPRLTGSPAFLRAANYARQKLSDAGAANVHLERWPFGRGWELDRFSIEMIAPRYAPLLGYPEAWSPPTHGEVVATPVLTAGRSVTEIERLVPAMKGGIVMPQAIMTNFIATDRVQPTDPSAPAAIAPTAATRQNYCAPRVAPTAGGGRANQSPDAARIAQLINDGSPAVRLSPTRGLHGSLFLQGGRYNAAPRCHERRPRRRAIQHGRTPARCGSSVKLRVNSQSHFTDGDTSGYNIIAEIPGTDPRLRDQVVMAGAHLDSWHSSLGAADNADGAAVMLEVVRILEAVGARPRRTIRIALWGGEEEGLLGSCAWTRQHLLSDSARARNVDVPEHGPGHGADLRLLYGRQRCREGDLRCLARPVQGSRLPQEPRVRHRQHGPPQLHRAGRAGIQSRSRTTPITTHASITPIGIRRSACRSMG